MQPKPNIIILLVDSLRADHLSCYGYPRPTSPFLERFCSQSAVFETAISQADYTHPSHGALFTGLYPFEWGGNTPRLPEEIPTIAQILSQAGWNTFCVSANPFIWGHHGLNHGFNTTIPVAPFGRLSPISAPGRVITTLKGHKGGPIMVREILKCARQQPFFIFANFMEVHQPYSGALCDIKHFFGGLAGPLRRWYLLWKARRLYQFIATANAYYRRLLVDAYDTAVRCIDRLLGNLLAAFEQQGILDNTIVIITADHGHFLGERGRVVGSGLGEGVVHVPLIIRYPEVWSTETRIRTAVELRDVPYSICQLLDLPGLADSCRPRVNLFEDISGLQDRFAFAMREKLAPATRESFQKNNPAFDWDKYDHEYFLLRTAEWEFIETPGPLGGLFRPNEDPAEEHDLSAEFPQVVEHFRKALHELLSKRSQSTSVSYHTDSAKSVEEHLRGLGYL